MPPVEIFLKDCPFWTVVIVAQDKFDTNSIQRVPRNYCYSGEDGVGISLPMAEMQQPNIKRIETDGLPAAGEYVLVHCGTYRCLGFLDSTGRWMDARGNTLCNVIGYYPLD